MNNGLWRYRHAAALGLVALLAGCGGGGGGGSDVAQCTANCVSGQVQNSSGQGVSGVYVTATNTSTGQVCATSTAPTAADGSYVISLSTCGGGQWPVLISAPGGVNVSTLGGANSSTSGSTVSPDSSGNGSTSGTSSQPDGSPANGGAGTVGSSSADQSGAGGSSSVSNPTSSSTSQTSTPSTAGGTTGGGNISTPTASASAPNSSNAGSGTATGSAGSPTSVLVNSWAPGQSNTGVDLSPATTNSIAAFAGTWTASYVPTDPRGDSGSCALTLNSQGVITATQPNCTSTQSGPFILSGTVNSTGQFGGATSTGGAYTGMFTVALSHASGSWRNGNDGGTWTASKTSN